MIRYLLIGTLLWGSFSLQAQLIEAYKEEVDLTKETTFGINLNTIGGAIGGVDFRYAKKAADGEWDALYLELVNIKHSKEIRTPAAATGNVFVPGKINYFFALRAQYGKEKRLFWKGKEDGVRLSWLYAGGLSLGLLKPYYIEYDFSTYVYDSNGSLILNQSIFDTRTEPYDPNIHTNIGGRILGAGSFGSGFNELKPRMGINGKIGVNFEFGMFDQVVSGVEIGVLAEYYLQEIIMFPDPIKPQKMFTSVYLSIYFGSRK